MVRKFFRKKTTSELINERKRLDARVREAERRAAIKAEISENKRRIKQARGRTVFGTLGSASLSVGAGVARRAVASAEASSRPKKRRKSKSTRKTRSSRKPSVADAFDLFSGF